MIKSIDDKLGGDICIIKDSDKREEYTWKPKDEIRCSVCEGYRKGCIGYQLTQKYYRHKK